MNNTQYWSLNCGLCLALFATLHTLDQQQQARNPASLLEPISLEIKNVQLPHGSKVDRLSDITLRATFNRRLTVDLLPGRTLDMASGQSADVNIKIPIDPSWIHNDQLEFKLEFVKKGLIDQVVVRCAQVSKKVSEYNRSYQCFIPGDELALVTYRLGNERVGISSLAQK
jgi:hypothetical protein